MDWHSCQLSSRHVSSSLTLAELPYVFVDVVASYDTEKLMQSSHFLGQPVPRERRVSIICRTLPENGSISKWAGMYLTDTSWDYQKSGRISHDAVPPPTSLKGKVVLSWNTCCPCCCQCRSCGTSKIWLSIQEDMQGFQWQQQWYCITCEVLPALPFKASRGIVWPGYKGCMFDHTWWFLRPCTVSTPSIGVCLFMYGLYIYPVLIFFLHNVCKLLMLWQC